jgi:polar amino acid transport system substrate-binding protein
MKKNLLIILIFLMSFLPRNSFAATPARLTVLYYAPPPHGLINALTLDVWQTLAEKLSINYKIRPVNSLAEAESLLLTGQGRIIVGPLNMQPGHEKIDYLNTYIPNSTGVLVYKNFWFNIDSKLKAIIFTLLGLGVSSFVLYILIFALILWLIERKHPESNFPKTPLKGIGAAIWFSITTISTVGYGDFVPKAVISRIITGFFIIISLATLSAFIASVSSAFTTHQLTFHALSKDTFVNKPVAYLASHTDTETLILKLKAIPVAEANWQTLITDVATKKVSAAFANEILLRNALLQYHNHNVELAPTLVNEKTFAFAMRTNDPGESVINKGLFSLQTNGEISALVNRTLGSQYSTSK